MSQVFIYTTHRSQHTPFYVILIRHVAVFSLPFTALASTSLFFYETKQQYGEQESMHINARQESSSSKGDCGQSFLLVA
jgi:hypothetical protein